MASSSNASATSCRGAVPGGLCANQKAYMSRGEREMLIEKRPVLNRWASEVLVNVAGVIFARSVSRLTALARINGISCLLSVIFFC
jgi:hypothetical protein